jgi:parallel beta-helix repeat protein
MKNNLFFQVLFLLAVLATSCQKESIELFDNSKLNNLSENSNITPAIATGFTMEQYQQLVATNEARLVGLDNQLSRETMQSITVPDDFATIQEAVDAASEGANIFVSAGTYTEDVTISTAGLKVQARKNVQLDGSFTLVEGANDVTIKKFSISNPAPFGTAVHGFGVTGGQIVQNTISAEAEGVHFASCDGSIIRDNIVTGADWAVIFSSITELGDGTCNNNTISSNTISGNAAVGIQVQGNCQFNTVSNNTVTDGSEFGNGGITLIGVPDDVGAPDVFLGDCENNVVKNNNCSNNRVGVFVIFNATFNNTIGPNNILNSNISNGLHSSFASDNHYFNNTMLNNPDCDVLIEGGSGNTFANNTYDCFTEL